MSLDIPTDKSADPSFNIQTKIYYKEQNNVTVQYSTEYSQSQQKTLQNIIKVS